MVASDAAPTPDDASGDLTLWSFPEGQLIKRLKGGPAAISSDWKYFATEHGVREIESDRIVTSLSAKIWADHAFSPDSRYVAESYSRSGMPATAIIELATGKQVSAFGKHRSFSLAFSSDSATVASGHWEAITLWNVLTGERVAALHGLSRYVVGLAFNRDGSLLAAANDLGSVEIWDMRRRARIHKIDLEGGYVSQPAFSPDGEYVAVGVYGTGTVFLMDVKTGKVVDQQKVSDLGCGSVAFSPDGRFLITPSTGGLIKWPYDRGGTVRVFRVYSEAAKR